MGKPEKPELDEAIKPEESSHSDPKRGGSPAFGAEGSNKTLPEPQSEGVPSGELTGTPTKNIPKSPYRSGSY
jgi:hypothetical protein